MNEPELYAKVHSCKYYHIIKVTEGISTPGDPVFVPVQDVCMDYVRRIDMKGKRVLDIGCRDGLFSFAAERLGAAEVIGIDNDLSKAAVEFLIPYFGSKVRMQEMNLYDLRASEMGVFDVVIFPGVLYHLRYPFWSLKIVRDVLKSGGDLLIETMIWDGMNGDAMLFCPTNTGHDATTCTLFNEKGLVDTMRSLGFELLSRRYADMSRGKGIRALPLRFKEAIKRVLIAARVFSVKRVTRGTFHFRYSGNSLENRFNTQYWESTHAFHTKGAT
jgi:2-polyprenyl-3-methyl-5-hydroxy-6-metoxy-1,4-benzoquinol methylase